METFLIFTRESVSLNSQGRYGKTYPCVGSTKMCWNERPSIQAIDKADALVKAKQSYAMRVKIVSQTEYMDAHDEHGLFDWNKLLRQLDTTVVKPVKSVVSVTPKVVTPSQSYQGNARGVTVSAHAIVRYKARSGSIETDQEISDKLLNWLERAREVELIRHYGVIALLNHGLRPAKYYRWHGDGGWTFVVTDGMIETIHRGEANHRWQEKVGKR